MKYRDSYELFDAVLSADVNRVAKLCRRVYDINRTDAMAFTALHHASSMRNPMADKIAGILISEGACIYARTRNGCYPLHLASTAGNISVVDILLAKAEKHSAQHGDYHGYSYIDSYSHAGETALVMAAHNGRMDVVRLLASRGANVNVEDRYGEKLIEWMASRGFIDESVVLIECGADAEVVKRRHPDKYKAILMAIESNSLKSSVSKRETALQDDGDAMGL